MRKLGPTIVAQSLLSVEAATADDLFSHITPEVATCPTGLSSFIAASQQHHSFQRCRHAVHCRLLWPQMSAEKQSHTIAIV